MPTQWYTRLLLLVLTTLISMMGSTRIAAQAAPPTLPRAANTGLWIAPSELAQLPVSGPTWQQLKQTADGSLGTPNIADQNSDHDVKTLAVALLYARTGTTAYRAKAASAILAAIGTERGGRTLALGRNLATYVIAADLIELRGYDAAKDQQFRAWLNIVRYERLDGGTLISTHERRANNWGTHAGASRIAADLYLGDSADLARAAQVFKGWLGDRGAYAGFSYGDLSWQANPSTPIGINPAGAMKAGHSIDGALPEEMRRGCSFRWPACSTGYPWGGLEGALMQAQLLSRAGYDAWNWSDRALLRAARFLLGLGWWNDGDDQWMPHLVNRAYHEHFPTRLPASIGKSFGFTDWLYGNG
jgi:hypothetical protein